MQRLDQLSNETDLEDALSNPSEADLATCRRLGGDVLVLGASGKMGPSLVHRLVRAMKASGARARVIAASRFSDSSVRSALEAAGALTTTVDLLDPASVRALPDCPNVLFLAGRKFGSTGNSALTWATNTLAPAYVADRFTQARIVAFSTGNVYPFVSTGSAGSVESDAPMPRGEYAQSCLGRERIFEHLSRANGTPMVLFRLNYAIDLRYGVLVDIARAVQQEQPVDRTVTKFNVIWQGDANSYALRALEGCEMPPRVLNVTGPEVLDVVEVAEYFGQRFGVRPLFRGSSSGEALLSDASACHRWLGPPEVPALALMDAVASWLLHNGRTLDKPTHFETADGKF